MPVNPKDFFKLYVLPPSVAWCEDEVCEWKALATAGGINALVEHVFRAINPTDTIGTPAYRQKLGDYRKNLECATEHRHIQYVVVVRPQFGFPYDDGRDATSAWIPLRQPVEKCIAYWKNHFGV